ncbi:hypothetical protein ACHAWF_016308 [Thalassiosira exigua]
MIVGVRHLLRRPTTLAAHRHRIPAPFAAAIGTTTVAPIEAAASMTTVPATAGAGEHYERHTAESYESAYFYSPGEYNDWLADLVRSTLRVRAETGRRRRRLVDVGGGTGNFTRAIVNDVPGTDAVVIDPFLGDDDDEDDEAMRGEGENGSKVRFVKASAEAFMPAAAEDDGGGSGGGGGEEEKPWWKRNYHQVLLKEVVHHFRDEERAEIFRGLREGLLPTEGARDATGGGVSPSILVITRPKVSIDYPLWPAAREVWASNQPSAAEIESDLIAAGFTDVGSKVHAYPCAIKLDRWLDMVRGRFWSTFSEFRDEELEEACANSIPMEANVDEGGVARFEDRLVFVTARR